MTERIDRKPWIIIPLVAIFAAGCSKQSRSFSLQGAVQKLRGPSASEMVKMAFDPTDADRRREGVVLLSKHDWGLEGSYLKGYATLLSTDSDSSVRSAAARALGEAGDATYLPDVINALDDESPSVRWDAAVALDNLIGPSAIDPLREHSLQDSSVDVRSACVQALRHYRTTHVIHTLKQCLDDQHFSVRYRAHASLVVILGRDHGYDSSNWPEDPNAIAAGQQPIKSKPWWDWFGVSGNKPNESERLDAARRDLSDRK